MAQSLLETNDDFAIRRLWQRVLLFAWSDATDGDLRIGEERYQKETVSDYRNAARHWLMEDTEDLREVCTRAGLDYKIVIEKAEKEFGGKT